MRKINKTDINGFCETALKYRKSANFFSSPEVLYNYIDRGDLYMTESNAGIFVFADTGDFFRLYYILTDMNTLDSFDFFGDIIKPIVTETAYRGDNPPPCIDYFTRCGFEHALTRSRMGLNNPTADTKTESDKLQININDIDAVLALFRDSFDRYTGCIPTLSELQKASDEGRIVTIVRENELCGALLYENSGATSSLSNLAVNSNIRGKGYGGLLVSSWIMRCAAAEKSILRLWVADNNIAAVRLYEKHRFRPDGLKSVVLVRR